MRKFYALLTGFLFIVLSNQSLALPPVPDVANFTFTVDAANNNVVFTNTSVLGNEPGIRKAFWHFGDGTYQQTQPLAGTQHHYQSSGTYNVCLKIYRYTSNTGDSVLSAQVCKSIIIESVCRANFEYRDSIISLNPLKHLVKFSALPFHNSNKPVTQVCWNFGDGTDTCININPTTPVNQLNIHHTYYQQGPFNVCVRIKYLDGCIAEKCSQVVLLPPAPDSCRAAFERINVSPTANPLHASFRALPWHSQNKKPVRICWLFGDGADTCIQYSNTYTGPYVVNHIYPNAGIYNVCVKILYEGGCLADKCEGIRVGRPDSCQADFEKLNVSTTNNPLRVTYKAIPIHNNNKKPARICWQFGDGTDTCINYPIIFNSPYTVTHTYNHPGNYQVCVTINYFGGCEARKCKPIQVGRPDTCRADFERLPLSISNNPLHASFKALPDHNNNRKPARVCWRFGDGTDTCINYPENYNGLYVVQHRYQLPGIYEVCVLINYYGGCEARKCRPVTMERPDSCRADFERIPLTASTPLVQGFKALPWHNNNKKPSKICWRFGDGTDTCINYPETYTGQYVVAHQYNQPGQYEVCVKIIYFGGCEAYKCKPVVIPPPPVTCQVRLFEITPSITSLVRGFYANPTSVPNRRPTRICWYFGDGTDTCIMLSPGTPLPTIGYFIRHTYPAPGTYRACVKVLFDGGCIAEDCKEVIIRSMPDLCGGYMRDSLTGPRTFRFTGFSIHAPNDEVIGYRWTFGDGTSALGREVTHTYNQAGNFEVCLYIKTRLGCETRICKTVRVPGNNLPALTLSPNPVINVMNVSFLSTHTEPVNIRILNGMGVAVRTYTRNAVVGSNTWIFDLSTLTPGVYSFTLQSPNQLASAIFLKQ
ncbi:MAG TPA: PKD domain-containing protein [Chitinophagaceae bacterium]|nr:PKD domain-containing protein [Chitinophagaceae bacterium]